MSTMPTSSGSDAAAARSAVPILTGGHGQFVTLGLGRDVFAVEVGRVREILDMRPVARLPGAPPFLLGVIDVRGHSVAVIDLRTRLGMAAVEATENTRILVLEVEAGGRGLLLGLVADRVFEVAELANGTIEPPPDIGVRWRSEYIRGIGRRGGNFVIVFDLDRLLTAEDVAYLGEAA